MNLCDLCRGISPQALTAEQPYPLAIDPENTRSGYDHLENFDDLPKSAENCAMCKMLLAELNERDIRPKAGRQPHSIVLIADTHHSDQRAPRGLAGMTALVTKSNLRAYFHLFALPDSPAALSGDVVGRPIRPDPASEESFQQIRAWIKECSRSHSECGFQHPVSALNQNRKFPTRLLDVGVCPFHDKSSCVLVDGATALGDYITLSYCWGKSQPLRSLKDNLAVHKQGISLEAMPATLRDAVTATRKLGIRYLWIDALCITQDDLSEWEQEAPEMGGIYQNSFCTLAAAASDSSAGGLFVYRHKAEPVVAFPYRHHKGRAETVGSTDDRFFISPVRHTLLNRVQETTWNSRGWVLQERILSRRIIYFGAGQTFFECQHQSLGEDGRDLGLYQHKRFSTKPLPQGEDWGWCLLIEDYTRRALTEPRDKLFAIEGLARSMAARTGKKYCAGLWGEKLQIHLMWYSKEGAMARTQFKRAPSWSWAYLDGPVMWEPLVLDAHARCEITIPSELYNLSPSTLATLDACIEFTGHVVAVERSEQTLVGGNGDYSGLAGNLLYLIDIEKHTSCYALHLAVTTSNHIERLGWAVFDEGNAVENPFVAAVISENNADNQSKMRSFNVLVLKQCDSSQSQFRRVGMGEITRSNSQFCGLKHSIRIL